MIRTSQVHVAEREQRILGAIPELLVTDEGFLLDSIAVDPSAQGTGVGRQLFEFAEQEAKRHGYDSLYLMTNEKMTENRGPLFANWVRSFRSTHRSWLSARSYAQDANVNPLRPNHSLNRTPLDGACAPSFGSPVSLLR